MSGVGEQNWYPTSKIGFFTDIDQRDADANCRPFQKSKHDLTRLGLLVDVMVQFSFDRGRSIAA
ncbi:hypothetical protein [Nocardia sp. NPDC046763]|uniref:hypothetical protein n=1 Tax=Nocardia sp. NPDC046763 TaxID=3155256 RepID=UPI003410FC31